MRWQPATAIIALLMLLSGCAQRESSLVGAYVAHDMGLTEFKPPVTLVLEQSHRFRFCVGTSCSTGQWSVQQLARGGNGRLTLNGAELERWLRDFNASAVRSNDPAWLDILDGTAEADYDVGPGSISITLGAGDAAFVKR